MVNPRDIAGNAEEEEEESGMGEEAKTDIKVVSARGQHVLMHRQRLTAITLFNITAKMYHFMATVSFLLLLLVLLHFPFFLFLIFVLCYC